MSTVSSLRTSLSVIPLEDRTTPAIMVWDTTWDPILPGTLPNAIAQANAAPGQDTIDFNFAALGNTPVFKVPLNTGTLEVKEGVIINAGTNNNT